LTFLSLAVARSPSVFRIAVQQHLPPP
jgi:hypothetical protein